MGTGATNLLRNSNRKVFFIIVDCSKEKVKVEYIEQVKDAQVYVVDERIRKKYIWQLDILNKFVGLFELPENQEIMKQVDTIHFVVTKAGMLGDVFRFDSSETIQIVDTIRMVTSSTKEKGWWDKLKETFG